MLGKILQAAAEGKVAVIFDVRVGGALRRVPS